MAHDKPSLLEFANKLGEGGKAEQELAGIIKDTIIARIEAAELRRVKAEQAALRLAMWTASAPVYNTRTRGKKVNYSEFGKESDDDEEEEEGESGERESRGERRSERNRVAEREVTEYTASGRMVKRPRVNTNGIETTNKMKGTSDESEEDEMEWSVYSDKGETENDDEDGEEEGVEEDYDIDVGRQFVVTFKVDKERLKAVISGLQQQSSMNGNLTSFETIQVMPLQHSPRIKIKGYQPQYQPLQQSPPRTYPPSTQNVGPVPYTGGSPPIPFRPTQLSPQPIPPPPLPPSPRQTYHVPQIPQYRPIPQPSPYPITQFSRPSPPTTYPPPNGIHQKSPPSLPQATFPQQSPPLRWNNQTVPPSQSSPKPQGTLPVLAFQSTPPQPSSTANGTLDRKSEGVSDKILQLDTIARQTEKISQSDNPPQRSTKILQMENGPEQNSKISLQENGPEKTNKILQPRNGPQLLSKAPERSMSLGSGQEKIGVNGSETLNEQSQG